MPRQDPDFTLETAAHAPQKLVAGVDEAGRGALAGPVVAACVLLNWQNYPKGIKDSKKLSPLQREKIFTALYKSATIGLGVADNKEIDRYNILKATMLAMSRAIKSLPASPCLVLIDGPHVPPCDSATRGVIGGDGKSLSIAAASIIAKVTRDRAMAELARQHPAYGWEKNCGYGTRLHMQALQRQGASCFHRQTFAPVRKVL